jgi:hypothetical protein
MRTISVTNRRSWGWFGAWSLVGAAYAVGFVEILSIGIFVLPVAIIGTVLLVRLPASWRGVPGLVAGLGIPLLYVAYLNRGYGRPTCLTSGSATPQHGVVYQCTQTLDPWPWLAAGLVLVVAGVVVLVARSRPSVLSSM